MRAAIWGAGYPTTLSLFFNVIFFLFLITVLNVLMQHTFQISGLNPSELLLIYTMLSVASAICGLDMMQQLITYVGGITWMANPENEWKDLFFHHIPKWLIVNDLDVLAGFHEGDSSIYLKSNILAWLTSVIFWSGFITLLAFVMLCLSVVVRKQWIEHEKLSYPIIQLPLHLTIQSNTFLTNKIMWTGFILSGGIDLVNGLHFLYPSVPSFGGQLYDLHPFFTTSPWNAIGWTPIPIFPYAVGLAFFMPLELSFACWFFYLFWKAQLIIGSFLGLRNLPNFPYIEAQTFGSYTGLCLLAFWSTRRHLKQIFSPVLAKKKNNISATKSVEVWAFAGACLGYILLISFSVLAGMSLWAAALFFTIYFALSIGITRMRAELGSPVHDLHWAGTHYTMVNTIGSRTFSPGNLAMFSFYQFFNRAYRGHIMPHQLEGFKLAERSRMQLNRLFLAILVSIIIGSLTSFWAALDASYQFGAFGSGRVTESFGQLQRWLTAPSSVDYGACVGIIFGFSFTLLLAILRMNLFWWPFHPAGYAVSSSWSINLFWFSIFISWCIKSITLKFGGVKFHQRAIPFFIGVILGEFIIGSLWMIRGAFLGVPTYKFLF